MQKTTRRRLPSNRQRRPDLSPAAGISYDPPPSRTPACSCQQGGCHTCTSVLQTWFVTAAKRLLRQEVTEPLTILSIVLPLRIRVGTSLVHSRRQVGRLLADIPELLDGLTFGIGGLDISANEAPDRTAFYQFQLWILVRTSEWQAQEAAIRKRFKPSPRVSVRRPLVAKVYDGRSQALAYALKPDFTRRVTVPATEGGRQNTRNRKLRVQQAAELRQLLDALGLDRRLVLIGVRKQEQADGRVRLVRDQAQHGGQST